MLQRHSQVELYIESFTRLTTS